MYKVYKSRVDKWHLWTCIGSTVAFIGFMFLCYKEPWVLLINILFMGICLCGLFDIIKHTDYTIKDDKLYIRCGVLFHLTLPISKIAEISHKSTILSSPSLSAKRIGLRYGRKNWCHVSPENQEDFIANIISINPDITIS